MAWDLKGNIKGPKGDKGDKGDTGNPGSPGAPGTPAVVRAARATTNAAGAYTWTYPTPFAAGVVPVISVVAVGPNPAGTNVVNAQLVGQPTNTSCTIQVTRTSITVVSLLGLSILSVPASVATDIHLFAVEST